MDIERLVRESFGDYRNQFMDLIVFTAVGMVLCLLIIPIPAVVTGYARGFRKYVNEGIKPGLSELVAFDRYFQMLLLLIVGGLALSIGYSLLVVPGILVATVIMYAPFYVADYEMDFINAIEASWSAVKDNFMQHFVVVLISTILAWIGMIVLGVGVIFTTPPAMIMLAKAFSESSGTWQ